MSLPTSFNVNPVRPLQAGDTVDLDDELIAISLSDNGNSLGTPRGAATVVINGFAELFTDNNATEAGGRFVPIETVAVPLTVTNLTAQGVQADQIIAMNIKLADSVTINPLSFLGPTTSFPGVLSPWSIADKLVVKFGKFIGARSAEFERGLSDPFKETLSFGDIPLQGITNNTGSTTDFVGFVQILQYQGGSPN